MEPHFKHVKEIFLAAVEREDPAARTAYLEAACGADVALRQQVEALLQKHEQAGGFLESPVLDPGATADSANGEEEEERRKATAYIPAEAVGHCIGQYKLLQKLGEGGMGVVWVAEQTEPVKRRVALKVIKPGMDSRQILRRFEAERQALALMDHSNIAKVFEAGTTAAGRPYFVMELVQGVPITRYCDELHLTVHERLELFVPICQAIQHAHQKGIIHRDIKPSNVLVCMQDGRPMSKVIDFGIAKALHQRLTDDSLYTEIGAIVGTLEYMSPEQAEMSPLGVDTRADVYALGVLLYELLTGFTPLDKRRLHRVAYTELVRMIKEEVPSKPSTRLTESEETVAGVAALRRTEPARLAKELRGDLDWIVMKALEKDRTRRYEAAGAFARDVERYLHDEPVEACPPSATYRLSKFVRRNKGSVMAATFLILSLVAGIIGTSWGLVQAERARRAEIEQRDIARANEEKAIAAAEAEKRSKETAETRESETRAVLNFVEKKIFSAARPQGKSGGLGRNVTLRQAIDAALPDVDTSFRDQPLIEARLRMTLGDCYRDLGEPAAALDQFQKARSIYAKQRGADDPDTLMSMNKVANGYADLDRRGEALQLREETLALRKARLGADHPDTLQSMNNLAGSYFQTGRPADAVKLCEEVLALRKAKLGADHPDTLDSMNNLAASYRAIGRFSEAVKLFEETFALKKAKRGPEDPETIMSMNNLALSYVDVGRSADAVNLLEQTLAMDKTRLGPGHPDTLDDMERLADCYDNLGRHTDALKLTEETLAGRKAKLGPQHRLTLRSMFNLSASYAAVGRHAEALKLGEETLALQKNILGPDNPETLRSMNNVANIYGNVGRHADALKLHQETLTFRKAKLGADHPESLESMSHLAASLAKAERDREALSVIDECLRLVAGKESDPGLIPDVLDLRLRCFQKSKDAAGCRATAEMWEKLKRTDADSLYRAARFRAATAAALTTTDKSGSSAKQASDEADQAMAWLKQAVAAGFKDAARMNNDTDLAALRDREDYKKLLAEVKSRQEKEKKQKQ